MAKRVISTKSPDSPIIDSPALLGRLIRAKRTALQLKLKDCAALCGVGINTLSRLEKGNPNCTLGATFAVLNGLGMKFNIARGHPDDANDLH